VSGELLHLVLALQFAQLVLHLGDACGVRVLVLTLVLRLPLRRCFVLRVIHELVAVLLRELSERIGVALQLLQLALELAETIDGRLRSRCVELPGPAVRHDRLVLRGLTSTLCCGLNCPIRGLRCVRHLV
jgi:hypothetical protein